MNWLYKMGDKVSIPHEGELGENEGYEPNGGYRVLFADGSVFSYDADEIQPANYS